jgi:hypothetical protein
MRPVTQADRRARTPEQGYWRTIGKRS